MGRCSLVYLRSASGILKIIEVVSVSVSLGLFRGVPLTFGDSRHTSVHVGTDADFFSGGVMVAALLITPLLFLLYVAGVAGLQHTILEIAINFLLFSFLLISGSVGMAFWHSPPSDWASHKAEGISMSVFLYAGSVAYLLDTVLVTKNYCCGPKVRLSEPSESTA
ncbi:hypothetical protein OTU49_016362 [Cherax quadricarinatus]|uniref:MARVEL domain-containing protein n=1 Tax=Cherax quadricarinatus TaxID=27406 RepID=A0AAW0YS38_CHEQU|nr:uncharacterized protein LOC128689983 [Cherax quadricarinatus]